MIRAGLLGLAIAIGGIGLAQAAAPPPNPLRVQHQTKPPPDLLGTLDPATGVFKPDVPPPTGSNIQGTLNFVFNLDAKNVSSVSVECSVTLSTYVDTSDGPTVGSDYATGFYLTYDASSSKFVGTLPTPFDFSSPATGTYRTNVTVTCIYLAQNTPAFTFTQNGIALVGGQNDVPVTGVMNGASTN